MESYRLIISFSILISFHVECSLRCACKEDLRTCASIHSMQADYKTAHLICTENGGKLLTPSSETIDSLLFNKTGHFWIGAEGNCRNSAEGDIVTLTRGGEDKPCSPRCMLVSNNRKFTERFCEERADGFLCDGIQWENCWEDRAFEVQILNEKDCSHAPCEHNCEEVPGGHMCSCFKRFRPSSKYPERCEFYCDTAMCPQLCPTCSKCPVGFIKDETQCIDLDECKSNHNCEQNCSNTAGSYKCSCHKGFMLVNKSKCVPLINPTPLTAALVTPYVNSTLKRAALATPAEYIGLIFFIILAIFALIGLLYYLRKSKSDVLLKDRNALDGTTVQEAQLQV